MNPAFDSQIVDMNSSVLLFIFILESHEGIVVQNVFFCTFNVFFNGMTSVGNVCIQFLKLLSLFFLLYQV